MSLSGVKITILNGALGSVPGTSDGIAGMVLSGVAVVAKIALNEPKQVFSLKGAEALGLNAAYDTANTTDVYWQIKKFYEQAGTGKELWIMLVAKTVTMEDMADITEITNAKKLLDAAKGTIRLLGFSRVPDGTYVPTVTGGLDSDVMAAVAKAQALAEAYTANVRPLRCIVAGRGWSGVSGDLADLNQRSDNRVMVTLCGQGAGIENANIGSILGVLAKNPVQRKASRVRSGALQILESEAFLTDGNSVEASADAIESIHNKGYVLYRKHEQKEGYYFTSDRMATASTDDYKYIARGRVMDKILILAYSKFVDEVDDDLEINPDGTLSASYVKSLQGEIEKTIKTSMISAQELSSVTCTIDPTQNVLATDKLWTSIKAIPRGYTSEVNVEIGFSNPLNS